MAQNQEYKTGDVFLFESDGSCVSDLICLLSDSDVSHSGIYFENDELLEEHFEGLSKRKVTDAIKGRKVHYMQYVRRDQCAGQLLAAARKHLESKDAYSMGVLLTLGVLITCKRFSGSSRFVRALLLLICKGLSWLIDEVTHHGKKAMVCSQFVCVCYDEAGFTLQVPHPFVSSKKARAALLAGGREPVSLLELAREDLRQRDPEAILAGIAELKAAHAGQRLFSQEGFKDEFTKICCKLRDALVNKKGSGKALETVDDLDEEDRAELMRLVHLFASLTVEISGYRPKEAGALSGAGGEARRNALTANLNILDDIVADYITPGDLHKGCPELIERDLPGTK